MNSISRCTDEDLHREFIVTRRCEGIEKKNSWDYSAFHSKLRSDFLFWFEFCFDSIFPFIVSLESAKYDFCVDAMCCKWFGIHRTEHDPQEGLMRWLPNRLLSFTHSPLLFSLLTLFYHSMSFKRLPIFDWNIKK